MFRDLRRAALLGGLLAVVVLLLVPQTGLAHCQIPCGLYDDHARVQAEHNCKKSTI